MSKDKWSALSAQERAQLINIYVQSGITDLDFIKKDYNSFDEGGTIEEYDVPFPKNDDINVPYRSVITDSMKEDFITKSKNKFDTFVNKMYPIVERSLLDAGYSTDNLNNVLRQMAQESNYGLSPRGNGYNLSGIKAWDSKEGTKHKDGYYYRNFKDYRDYADYHVALLNNRYNALDANDTKDFVYKLHHTKDGKKYSADEKGYKKNLTGMYSLDKAIKKYESDSAKGVRILDGNTEDNQTLDNTPWYKKVSDALIEGARMGRDARIGAVGAEPLREMYASGQSEEADKLAKQYVRANTAGIGIGAGAATSNILGDLLVTAGTAGLDTLLEDDINFKKVVSNIGKAIAADVVIPIIGGIPTIIKSAKKVKEKLVPSSVKDVIKHIKTKDDRILDKDNFVELINNASKEDLEELKNLTRWYDGDWGLIEPLIDVKLGNLNNFHAGLNDAMQKMRHGKTTNSKFIDDATSVINNAWDKYISSGGNNGLSIRHLHSNVVPAKKYLSHGIPVTLFRKALKSRKGEAIMPSLAILPQDVANEWANQNILFLGDKSLLDKAIIYKNDAWTPIVGKVKDIESKTNKQVLEEMLKIPNEENVPILSIDDVNKTIWNRELPTEEVQHQNSFSKWFFDRVPTKSVSSGTQYMEAKYQDVLPFNSFKHAIIPFDATDVIEWAKTNKMPYTTYDKYNTKENLKLYPTIQKVLEDSDLLFNKGGFLQNNHKN